MIDIRPLAHLIAIVEHGRFGAASRALGISQPALTKNIQKLERELGTKLLDRSRKQVTLTPIGRRVVERAVPLVRGTAELCREVNLLRGVEIGTLSVGVGPTMADSFVTVAIARLAEQNPQVRIHVRVDHWTQLSEWLHAGQLDLYVADITEVAEDERVEIVRLPSQHFVCFCRKGHPLAKLRRVTRKDLLKYPIATTKMPEWARRWIAEAVDSKSEFDPDRAYNTIECEHYAMLKKMVLNSDCVSAALASTIAAEVKDGSIVTLPIMTKVLKTAAGIVSLRGRTPSPIAERFIGEVTKASKSVTRRRS